MAYTSPLRPEDPERIGGYRLTARLGEGGQGIVYLASDADGGAVALKLLHARLVRRADVHHRLAEEIALVRRVAEFCTARIVDFGADGDRSYIVSEHVDGPSLQALVESDGPLSGGGLARLMVGTVSALIATHGAGVVHRDFTPHNVLIGSDGPRVIDFGVAWALDTSATVTSSIVGTPAYTAPEVLRRNTGALGPPSDIFSWAVTMVFAATGRLPFGRDSIATVFYRILHEDPDILDVPSPYREILGRCLAKEPEERPTAREVLFHLLEHQDVEAASSRLRLPEGIRDPDRVTVDRPDRSGPPDHRIDRSGGVPWWRRRDWPLIAAGTAVLVAGVSALAFTLSSHHRPAPHVTHPPVPPPSVTVGSANFPENVLLAEVYAQALEAKGYRVTRKFNLGDRETYLGQVQSGDIDVIPEYNGALATLLDGSSDATSEAEVDGVLRRELPPQLEMLTSSTAEDKDSVTVTMRTASLYGLRTIGDLAAVAGRMVMGGSSEFQTRHQGLVGLRGTYGLGFHSYQPFATNDRETMIEQLKTDRIQAANLFTTEPSIKQNAFVVLKDPKHLFTAQNVTPLIYRAALSATGRTVLNAVSAKLTTDDLLDMNTKISVNRIDTRTVAKEWLQQVGLVSP